jgi:hypothetical protein
MRLREIRFDDYDGIGAVLVRNGLRRPTPEQWTYLWNANPHREQLAGIPLGWVLEHDPDGLVGTFRNIPFLYEWNGRPIKVAVASAWAVDPIHRHQSLRLAMEYFKQPLVDVLLNTTAVAETSGKAFLKFRAERVPQPAYTTRLLWITGYVGFAASLLRARRIPAASVLQYPAASGAKLADVVRYRRSRAHEPVVIVDAFDARFDRFWGAMRQRRERLHAVRDAATLTWRFALERQRPTIVAVPRGNTLAGYAVLVRRDQGELLRFEVADLQALDDDARVLRAVVSGALGAAARQGVHLVAMTGFCGAKRHALNALKPHVKTVPGWPLYYKSIDGTLEEPLRSADAWDLSLYDGDTLWSGMFADSAVA